MTEFLKRKSEIWDFFKMNINQVKKELPRNRGKR